MALDKLIMNDY